MELENQTLDVGELGTRDVPDGSGAGARDTAFLVVHIQGSPESRLYKLSPQDPLTIGRSRGATIMVDHDAVSRLHARLRLDKQRLLLRDEGSRNGTKVNGERIAGEVLLRAGDEITIGPMVAIVSSASKARSSAYIVDADTLEARWRAELDRCKRYHRPVSLALLRVRGDEAAVEALPDYLRPMDLLGDYGNNEFGLLLPELAPSAAADYVRRLASEAHKHGVVMRAGVVTAPGDGLSVYACLGKARRALRAAPAWGDVAALPEEAAGAGQGPVLVSAVIQRIYGLVERVADSSLTVLILGETGVGKEFVAEAVVRSSARKQQQLVRLNCAALPEPLLESELFGHERGAFTGADKRKLGYFEVASGGTLFLDEIGEMPLALQAKLLRVLESKQITRVGGTESISVDVRVVAATHRDLEAEVRAGRFREDLYYRIAGFTVMIPPLRERRDEIGPLAHHFLAQHAQASGQTLSLSEEALAALARHDWPGNIRELKNAMERAAAIHEGSVIRVEDLPERCWAHDQGEPGGGGNSEMRAQLADVERAAIFAALTESKQNQTHAAKKLGISRRALIYKMEKYGLKAPPASQGSGEASPALEPL